MSFVVVVVKIKKNLKKKLPRVQASLSMKRLEGKTGEKSGRSLMGGRVMEHKYKIFRNEFKRFTLHSWRIKLLVHTLCVRRLFSSKELASSNITGFITQA